MLLRHLPTLLLRLLPPRLFLLVMSLLRLVVPVVLTLAFAGPITLSATALVRDLLPLLGYGDPGEDILRPDDLQKSVLEEPLHLSLSFPSLALELLHCVASILPLLSFRARLAVGHAHIEERLAKKTFQV
jgi:hypothetical protein